VSENRTLWETALDVGVVLANAIDSIAEDIEDGCSDGLPDTWDELRDAYATLCKTLSRELWIDANAVIKQMIDADLMTSRTILTAQTGIRFAVSAGK
jgi:hypothetical protein